jgi:virulence-associated protein VagC
MLRYAFTNIPFILIIFTFMYVKYFCGILFFALSATLNVQAKGRKKKVKPSVKILQAYSQRTLAGIPGIEPKTDYHFFVIWEGAKYPSTVFWRGENGWLTCNIYKAHYINTRSINIPKEFDFRSDPVEIGAIRKGDTLEFRPVTGGRFPVPKEIRDDVKNTLFYKTGGSGWLQCLVKNITVKPDIAMP